MSRNYTDPFKAQNPFEPNNPYPGYNQRDNTVGTKKVQVEMRFSDVVMSELPEEIKDEKIRRQLIDNLVQELYKSEFLEFKKQKRAQDFGLETDYAVCINAADKQFTNTIVSENYFFWKGREWSEAEIIEGLKQANPEYIV